MPEYVYILSTYDEYGAQDVRATLRRDELPSLLQNYRALVGEFHEAEERLSEVTKSEDKDLADRDGIELQKGWGGVMLHVALLE